MIKRLLRFFTVKHKDSEEVDVILSLVVFAVIIAGLKFLLDGVSVTIFGHLVNFGHTDSLSYGSMLTPILGAHGYISGQPTKSAGKVDNPDGDN